MKKPRAKAKVDWEDEVEVIAPNKQALSNIEKLITKAIGLSKQIDELKQMTNVLVEDFDKIMYHLIPDAMSSAGVSKFTTTQGVKVEVDDFLSGSLPKEDVKKREAALQWLHANGGLDIIKGMIVIPFSKGEHNFKEAIKSNLRDLKADYKEVEDVHASTLKAFAREKMKKGEEVPFETLGLFAGRRAKIENVKEVPEGVRRRKKVEQGDS